MKGGVSVKRQVPLWIIVQDRSRRDNPGAEGDPGKRSVL